MINNNEHRNYNEKMKDNRDMPKIRIIQSSGKSNKAKASVVIIAPPIEYDELMKKVPCSMVTTNDIIKVYLAKKYNADYTCPVSSRKFIVLAAFASVERSEDETPYWRTLKKDGELNGKYPSGIEMQKLLLEREGHTIIQIDKRYYVKDYMTKIFDFR